tara:strand:- start:264 stop:482 length:219 start_codon:yes stop_codon:yes gene_type:complete
MGPDGTRTLRLSRQKNMEYKKKTGQFLRRISEVHAFCEDGSRKITTNHFEEYQMMRLNTAVEGVPLPQFVSE